MIVCSILDIPRSEFNLLLLKQLLYLQDLLSSRSQIQVSESYLEVQILHVEIVPALYFVTLFISSLLRDKKGFLTYRSCKRGG